ncbi:Insulin-induced protein 2 protein [Mortierella claussenii]|nr:Insulin-induced protein 2 protein [Mortierella claussenii]
MTRTTAGSMITSPKADSAALNSTETTAATSTTIPGSNTNTHIYNSHSSSSSISGHSKTARLVSADGAGPYLFVFDVAVSLYYPIRAMILFILGFVFSLVIDHLQTQHQLVQYHPGNSSASSSISTSTSGSTIVMGSNLSLWDTASWLPPTCGASAVLIGTIYPLGDYLWWGRRVHRNGRDWSSVMRCMGGFIGVNYAASKLPWTSSIQVSCTLALISAALWFLFDRTLHGFVISLTVASMGTTVAYFLVLNGWYSFTRADFFGVGSWIPCILYSSSVCFGSIGRQLDVVPETWYHSNNSRHSLGRVHLKSE